MAHVEAWKRDASSSLKGSAASTVGAEIQAAAAAASKDDPQILQRTLYTALTQPGACDSNIGTGSEIPWDTLDLN
jgi:hypothetical protein